MTPVDWAVSHVSVIPSHDTVLDPGAMAGPEMGPSFPCLESLPCRNPTPHPPSTLVIPNNSMVVRPSSTAALNLFFSHFFVFLACCIFFAIVVSAHIPIHSTSLHSSLLTVTGGHIPPLPSKRYPVPMATAISTGSKKTPPGGHRPTTDTTTAEEPSQVERSVEPAKRARVTSLQPYFVPHYPEGYKQQQEGASLKDVYLSWLQEAVGGDAACVCVGHDVASGQDWLLQLNDKEWEEVDTLATYKPGTALHALVVVRNVTRNEWEVHVTARAPLYDEEEEEAAWMLRSCVLPLEDGLSRVHMVPANGRHLLQRWVSGNLPAAEAHIVSRFVRANRAILDELAELAPLCRCLEGATAPRDTACDVDLPERKEAEDAQTPAAAGATPSTPVPAAVPQAKKDEEDVEHSDHSKHSEHFAHSKYSTHSDRQAMAAAVVKHWRLLSRMRDAVLRNTWTVREFFWH